MTEHASTIDPVLGFVSRPHFDKASVSDVRVTLLGSLYPGLQLTGVFRS